MGLLYLYLYLWCLLACRSYHLVWESASWFWSYWGHIQTVCTWASLKNVIYLKFGMCYTKHPKFSPCPWVFLVLPEMWYDRETGWTCLPWGSAVQFWYMQHITCQLSSDARLISGILWYVVTVLYLEAGKFDVKRKWIVFRVDNWKIFYWKMIRNDVTYVALSYNAAWCPFRGLKHLCKLLTFLLLSTWWLCYLLELLRNPSRTWISPFVVFLCSWGIKYSTLVLSASALSAVCSFSRPGFESLYSTAASCLYFEQM